MLPLWNKISARLTGSRACLGLSIGRDSLRAARVSVVEKGLHIDWVMMEHLPARLFTGSVSAEIQAALTAAIGKLCAPAKNSYLPVQVGLPDPAVSALVFELDTLPKERQAQLDLVRWRFAKSLHLDENKIECASQPLGSEDGKQLLLGLATDKTWLQCVRQALKEAGVVAAIIDMDACHRFNRFYTLLTAEKQDGALAYIDRDAWSLAIWDSQGRLRFIRSRWREDTAVQALAAECQEIATEVERAIRAYARPGASRAVAHVFITGPENDVGQLAAILDERMHGQPRMLTQEEGFLYESRSFLANASMIGPALTAAIAR
ncbi:MAG TPA: hypothetical protein VK138_12220 [Acidiferrobacterales bacterium]|nr:hypothetical protein [Acidiferrobacterales bacterium]